MDAEASDSASSAPSTATEASQDGPLVEGFEDALPDVQFVLNERSGVVHRSVAGELVCGKPRPLRRCELDELSPDLRLCRRCF